MISVQTPKQKAYEARLKRMPPVAKGIIAQAITKSGDEAEKLVRRNVPVSDEAPHIRDTIARTQKQLSASIAVGSVIRPAAPLEFGHKDHRSGKKIKAVPFFYPALKVVIKRHRGRVNRAISKAVKTVFNK